MLVNMHQATTEFSKLIEAAERGEEVIISRDGKPAVQLIPVSRRKIRLGTLKNKVRVPRQGRES